MSRAQPLGNLLGQFEGFDDRQRLPLVAQLGQTAGQCFAGEIVDDRIGEAVIGHVEVTDDGDVGVFQLGDGLHPAAEAGGQVFVLFIGGAQHFQKDETLQLDVTREEKIAGVTGRDVGFYFVVAYLLTGQVFFIPSHHTQYTRAGPPHGVRSVLGNAPSPAK